MSCEVLSLLGGFQSSEFIRWVSGQIRWIRKFGIKLGYWRRCGLCSFDFIWDLRSWVRWMNYRGLGGLGVRCKVLMRGTFLWIKFSSLDEICTSELFLISCEFTGHVANPTVCGILQCFQWLSCEEFHKVESPLGVFESSGLAGFIHKFSWFSLNYHMRPFNISVRPGIKKVRLQGFRWLGLRSLSLTSLHSEPCKAIPTGPHHETESLLGTALLALSLLSLTHFL